MAALIELVAFSIPKGREGIIDPTYNLQKISEERGMTPQRYMAELLGRAYSEIHDNPTTAGKYTAFEQPEKYNARKVGELIYHYQEPGLNADLRIISKFTEEFFLMDSYKDSFCFCPVSTLYIGVEPEHSSYTEAGSWLHRIAHLGVRGIAARVSEELIKEGIEHSVRFFEHEEVMQHELTEFYQKLGLEK